MTRLSLIAVSLLLAACYDPTVGREDPTPAEPSPDQHTVTPPHPEPKLAMNWQPVTTATPKATPAGPRSPEAPSTSPRAKVEPVKTGGPKTAKGNVTVTTQLSNPNLLVKGDGKVSLEIGLEATKLASKNRLPMNVALVIDRSGSMRGDKIAQTRAAAKHFVEQLTSKDTLAIVSYSDDVRVDLPASPMNDVTRKQAIEAISKIRPGGSTNLSGGLFRGQDEVQRNLRSNQVNRVVLMSDGLANRGITDTKQLASKAQQQAQRGVSVTTMGVGSDYNEDLMTAVADHASGNYYFIQDSDQIASVFTQELNKMFATVAQNVTVKLLVEDGVDLEQVFGYTFTRQGDVVSIPLAELFAGQKRSILVALKAPVMRTGAQRLAEVTLEYTDVASEGEARVATLAQSVMVTSNKSLVEKSRNKSVEEKVGEVEVATAINDAANLLRDGEADKAQAVLRGALLSNEGRISAMGGSGRLARQSQALEELQDDFKAAEAAPAAAAPMIKRAKASSRTLVR